MRGAKLEGGEALRGLLVAPYSLVVCSFAVMRVSYLFFLPSYAQQGALSRRTALQRNQPMVPRANRI